MGRDPATRLMSRSHSRSTHRRRLSRADHNVCPRRWGVSAQRCRWGNYGRAQCQEAAGCSQHIAVDCGATRELDCPFLAGVPNRACQNSFWTNRTHRVFESRAYPLCCRIISLAGSRLALRRPIVDRRRLPRASRRYFHCCVTGHATPDYLAADTLWHPRYQGKLGLLSCIGRSSLTGWTSLDSARPPASRSVQVCRSAGSSASTVSNTNTGEVLGETANRHTTAEFTASLNDIVDQPNCAAKRRRRRQSFGRKSTPATRLPGRTPNVRCSSRHLLVRFRAAQRAIEPRNSECCPKRWSQRSHCGLDAEWRESERQTGLRVSRCDASNVPH
jgi:hypothetical protein